MQQYINMYNQYSSKISCYLMPFITLGMRILLGMVFWKASQTKLADWNATLFLFEYEYAVPLLPVALSAFMATALELVGSIALFLGFATRFFSLAFIGMTAVIEFFVYPGVQDHYFWFLCLGTLLSYGGGLFSVDYLLKRYGCSILCKK